MIFKLILKLKGVFTHKTSLVNTLNIGKGTRIWAFTNIRPGVIIGKNCNICDHCFIEDGVLLGDNITIKTGISLWDGVFIEDNVFIGPGVQFCNDKYPRSKKYIKPIKTTLKKGCSIGAGAVILPGIVIGENAIVGAGSVVTKNIPSNITVCGNPAKKIKES